MPGPYGPIESWPQRESAEPRVCPTCGIKLEQVMYYVCYNVNCPTGLGGVKC